MASTLAMGGCFGGAAYPCDEDEQCRIDGRSGVCEAQGYCSLPDDDCASGRRFSEHAPAELSRTCVDEVGSGSESSDDGMAPGCEGEDCGCAAQLLATLDRTCVVDFDGALWCWGANDQGQLGDPTDLVDADEPRRVPITVPVLDVALDAHACAVIDGGVECWGPDQQGQVSIVGPQEMGAPPLAPTPPGDVRVSGAEVIAVGERWSCALVGGRQQLLCWGELVHVGGAGDTWSVELGGPADALSMTRRSVCVGMADGRVLCAGSNFAGGLGAPTTLAESFELVGVEGIGVATGLASSQDQYCARTDDGLWCWGLNQDGEVGVEGSGTGVPTLPTMVDVSAQTVGLGTRSACATTGDAVPSCWGRPVPGISAPSSHLPDPLTWLGEIVDGAVVGVALGSEHACVLTDRAQVWCWGNNARGQLGIPGGDGMVPQRVPLPCPS